MTSGLLASSQPSRGSHRQEPFARVAPVLSGALLIGASGGFVLAAVLTSTQAAHVAGGLWWRALVQAHGHLQLYGWAGLFVLGVALHFLPRLRGAPLAFAHYVPWILGALVASLALRAVCQPLVTLSGAGLWRVGLVLSGLLEALALGGAVAVLAVTARRGPPMTTRPALWSVVPFIITAFSALGLASLVNLGNMIAAAMAPSGLAAPTGDDLNVTLGLLGFLVPMALAMSARSLPMYAGLDAFPKRTLWPTAFTYVAGLALALLGIVAGNRVGSWSGAIAGLGLALVGGVLLVYVAIFMRMMTTRGRLPQRVAKLAPSPEAATRSYQTRVVHERGAFGPFVALVASAYLWAVLGGVLLVINGLAQLIGLAPPLAPDAARHSLALGFIALLICGISPRMVPGFSGGRILSPALVVATLWLGNAAALLRVGSLLLAPALAATGPAGAGVDALAFGLSGPVGLALAICLAVNLWPAIWPARPTPVEAE
jgi:uncharacterized protein involved in response to NO